MDRHPLLEALHRGQPVGGEEHTTEVGVSADPALQRRRGQATVVQPKQRGVDEVRRSLATGERLVELVIAEQLTPGRDELPDARHLTGIRLHLQLLEIPQ